MAHSPEAGPPGRSDPERPGKSRKQRGRSAEALAGILSAEADKPVQPKPERPESRERITRTLAGTLFERRREEDKAAQPKAEAVGGEVKAVETAEGDTEKPEDREEVDLVSEFKPAEWAAQTRTVLRPREIDHGEGIIELDHVPKVYDRTDSEAEPSDRDVAELVASAEERTLITGEAGRDSGGDEPPEPPEYFEDGEASDGSDPDEPPEPPEHISGAGGGEPPEPPEAGRPFSYEPPEPPERPEVPTAYGSRPEPAAVFRHYAEQDALAQHAVDIQHGGVASNGERLLTEREAEEQAMYAQRRGVSSGVASGLVLGWWLRGRRAKKHEKKTAKEHKAAIRKLEKTQEDQRWVAKAQDQKQAETERQLRYVERRQQEAEKGRAAEQLARKRLEAEINLTPVAERPAEQIEVPNGNRLERSEWLTTQVDVRTGRPVEQPSFHYGREYYRERAAESMPIVHRNAAAGEVALVAAAMANGKSSGAGNGGSADTATPQSQPGQADSSTAHIPSATTSGPPPHAPHTSSPGSRQDDNSVWLYVAALVVIVILLYVALR